MEIVSNQYKVYKKVVFGDTFIEHHYTPCEESFIGRWKKVGQNVSENCELTCSFCKEDLLSRRKPENRLVLPPDATCQGLRSYQVQGFTNPSDFWEWEFGRCKNPDNCWGKNVRIFEVRRKKSNMQFMFSQYEYSGKKEHVIDRMYANLEKEAKSLVYSGVALKASHSTFFWPDLIPRVDKPSRFVLVEMESRNLLPENIKATPLCEWPLYYRRPSFKFPMNCEFRFFDEPKNNDGSRMPLPSGSRQLEDNYKEIARTLLGKA